MKSGISIEMDNKARETFKKIANSRHTSMRSVLLTFIDEYNKKHISEYIEKCSPKLLKD